MWETFNCKQLSRPRNNKNGFQLPSARKPPHFCLSYKHLIVALQFSGQYYYQIKFSILFTTPPTMHLSAPTRNSHLLFDVTVFFSVNRLICALRLNVWVSREKKYFFESRSLNETTKTNFSLCWCFSRNLLRLWKMKFVAFFLTTETFPVSCFKFMSLFVTNEFCVKCPWQAFLVFVFFVSFVCFWVLKKRVKKFHILCFKLGPDLLNVTLLMSKVKTDNLATESLITNK